MMGTIVRILVVLLSGAAGAAVGPALAIPLVFWALAGLVLGGLAVWLESHAARAPVEGLFWGTVGGFFGLVAGLAVGTAVASLLPRAGPVGLGLPALLGGYLGAAVALRRRADLEGISAILFPRVARRREPQKVLDTSVIIDGRIADVCETGVIEGTLVVPQFVLRELQQIADSPDGARRNRGRRGFDVLRRLQAMPKLTVEITTADFPEVRDVDGKLIQLARALGGKVVTNDGNLNRLAELSGVGVLNLNEVANALKPVVLPGEGLRVHVLREGKEAGQGVAYLDDGTMVVIEQGRKSLGQTIDVTVTSVLQTTAGRMIFTRPREEEPVAGQAPAGRDG